MKQSLVWCHMHAENTRQRGQTVLVFE